MPNRDPRIDPKAGDVLRLDLSSVGDGLDMQAVTVLWLTGYPDFIVAHHVREWDNRTPFKISIPLWREWSKNAEVIHAAD